MFERHATAILCAALIALAPAGIRTSWAQAAPTAPAASRPDEPVPKFDAAYLAEPSTLKLGESVWGKQCRHCHGNAAYPGKGPKLSPSAMDAEFIFDRVTYGFRQMPPWRDVFTREERKAVAAYIKSERFAP